MATSFRDKVVFITGASGGIGAELARQLAAKGARLALFARRTEQLGTLAAELRAKGAPAAAVCVVACDVTDRAGVLAAFATAAAALGPCDVLFANAGIGYPVPARRFDAREAQAIFAVNYNGALNAVEAVLPAMLARGSGHIVGISSLAAFRSYPESHVYCASKSALSAQLEGLRLELRSHGVAVTTICPGFIRTDMTAGNTVPMPFLLDCDVATARIVKAVERQAKVFAFPRRLYYLIMLSRRLPDALVAALTKPPKGKSYKEAPPVSRLQ